MSLLMVVELIVTTLTLIGCHQKPLLHTVILLDLSRSVSQEARGKMVDEVRKAGEMIKDEGSSIAVIVITEDASKGSELAFQVKVGERRGYNKHLEKFKKEFNEQLDQLEAKIDKKGYPRTDIVQTSRMATEYLQEVEEPSNSNKVIFILSDGIQDTEKLADFKTDPRLKSEEEARKFAIALSRGHEKDFLGITVYLGGVSSIDADNLSLSRRAAIKALWMTLFKQQGTKKVVVQDAGIEGLKRFLERQKG